MKIKIDTICTKQEKIKVKQKFPQNYYHEYLLQNQWSGASGYIYYATCRIASTVFAFKSRKNIFSGDYNEHICRIADGANKRLLTCFIERVNGFGILKEFKVWDVITQYWYKTAYN